MCRSIRVTHDPPLANVFSHWAGLAHTEVFSVKVVYSALLKEQKEKGTAREWAEANKKSDSERAQAVQHKLFTMVKRQCTWLVDVAAAEEFAEDLRQLSAGKGEMDVALTRWLTLEISAAKACALELDRRLALVGNAAK